MAASSGAKAAERAGAPRISLREEQKQLARQRILSAALDVFVSQGYQGSTVDDITTTAGMSRATFYLYFKGKKDIVAALVEENVADFREIYLRMPTGRDADADAVQRWIEEVFAFNESIRQRAIFYRQASIIDPEVLSMTERNYADIIRASWQRLAGELDPESPEGKTMWHRQRLFLGLIEATVFLAVVEKAVDREVSRRELTRLMHDYW